VLSMIPSASSTGGVGVAARRQTPSQQPLRDDWGDAGDDYGSYANFTPAATRAPTEQEIESVTALGFDRVAATNALRNTNNNVEAAVNMLLR